MSNFMATFLVLLGAFIMAATPVIAFSSYVSRIPNGNQVIYNGVAWSAIGHTSRFGGGSRNAFGNAFAAAGYAWTTALCQADSDNDGFSNGAELGDPNCVWTSGATPARTTDITHPALADSVPTQTTTVAPTPAPPTPTTAAPTPAPPTPTTMAPTPAPPLANVDCTNPQAPASSANYYAPPTECRNANSNVEACYAQWGQCIGNATNCANVTGCLQSFFVCISNIPNAASPVTNASAPCFGWNESFSNVKMYLDVGGAGVYSGTSLQAACNYAACTYVASAPKLNNGAVCPVPIGVCNAAPKAPPKFVLTFGGNWGPIVTSKPEIIRGALQRGIAKLLGVAEYVIRVLSFRTGSLVVEFATLDPTVDGAAVGTTLQAAASDQNTLAANFGELATEAGFAISLESIAAGEGSSVTLPLTPAPATPMPTSSSTPAPLLPSPTPVPGPTDTAAPETVAPEESSASTTSAVAAIALLTVILAY